MEMEESFPFFVCLSWSQGGHSSARRGSAHPSTQYYIDGLPS